MWDLPRVGGKRGRVNRTSAIPARHPLLGLALLVVLAAVARGCYREPPSDPPKVSTATVVRVVRPQRRNVAYTVGQPGFIKKFYVDIGQEVKKGDVLCDLFVPELEEEHQQKTAQVELDKKGVDQAQVLVKVAERNLPTAIAELAEAKVKVSEADARRVAALLAYTQVTAPYDSVVTVRNANTGDYVLAISARSPMGSQWRPRGKSPRPDPGKPRTLPLVSGRRFHPFGHQRPDELGAVAAEGARCAVLPVAALAPGLSACAVELNRPIRPPIMPELTLCTVQGPFSTAGRGIP